MKSEFVKGLFGIKSPSLNQMNLMNGREEFHGYSKAWKAGFWIGKKLKIHV